MAHLARGNNQPPRKVKRSFNPNEQSKNKRKTKTKNMRKPPRTKNKHNNMRKPQKVKNKDGIITWEKQDKVFFTIVGILFVIWLVIFIAINVWRSNVEMNIASEPIGQTYYQYLTDVKETKRKQEENTNVKAIANRLLEKEVGLTESNTYAKTGIYNKGCFIESAIIHGNGVPITTEYQGTSNNYQSFLNDSEYFKNVRQSQYNSMKTQAENNISNNDNKKQTLADLKNQINQAQKDAGAMKAQQNKNVPTK